jgi:hypothetical protein
MARRAMIPEGKEDQPCYKHNEYQKEPLAHRPCHRACLCTARVLLLREAEGPAEGHPPPPDGTGATLGLLKTFHGGLVVAIVPRDISRGLYVVKGYLGHRRCLRHSKN